MRKVISLIQKYFRKDFNARYSIAVAIYTALLIWVNYHFDFETRYITYEGNSLKQLGLYCLMYFIAFGGAYLLYLISKRDRKILYSGKLWVMILFSVFLFSFRTWFDEYQYILQHTVPSELQIVAYKCITNLQGFVWLFIPCFIYWFFVDRKKQPVYGFHSKGVVLWPYFVLLLLMVPLVFGASTQSDFLETYPRAFHLGLEQKGGDNFLLTLFYELCYSLDFVTTEFFFRGFLILGLARFAGPKVILPMCVFYVTIHFEKPLAETISSFFGGWILGILAYETRSIYGGVIVHLGIALLMEVVSFVMHVV